jgi:lipopolysaccharide/colanic/teichoic acid biosynthesis glycosyltransferase
VTAPTIAPALWSGHTWIDRLRPENRIVTGHAYNVLKRVFDLVVVIAAAPVWLIVFALCAAIIKLDDPSAPVIYSQPRVGLGGTTIKMHKFRTMVPNAEAMKAELQHLNELDPPDFKITNDPRVTGPGRLMRKASLDEIPQLWDVLMGRLSLVGPRPTDFMTSDYLLWQTERLDVKPGITGLWQLYGRGITTSLDDKTRLDIAYVQRRSLWLDIQILVRTIPSVLLQRGAT